MSDDVYGPCGNGCGMDVTYDLRSIDMQSYAAFWERPYSSPEAPDVFYTIIHSAGRCQTRKSALNGDVT